MTVDELIEVLQDCRDIVTEIEFDDGFESDGLLYYEQPTIPVSGYRIEGSTIYLLTKEPMFQFYQKIAEALELEEEEYG